MELQAPKPPMAIEGLVTEYYLKPADMTEWHTPVADLFVLAHMGIPEITLENWSLRIDGLVENPLELTFDELLRRPKRVVETVHQCAGNPMNPTTPARQIANVRWAGIDLRDLLAEIGVQSDATHLWAYGLDHGEFAGVEQDCYLKDIPISASTRVMYSSPTNSTTKNYLSSTAFQRGLSSPVFSARTA